MLNAAKTIVVGTAAAPSVSAANLPAALAAQIAKQMKSEVTAVDRFVDLLAQDPGATNKTLLKDQAEIEKRIVFDFNAAPTVGKGGPHLGGQPEELPNPHGAGHRWRCCFPQSLQHEFASLSLTCN